jgi:hypothetical protein
MITTTQNGVVSNDSTCALFLTSLFPNQQWISMVDQSNPYSSPEPEPSRDSESKSFDVSQENIDPVSLKKIETIIKDANQLWLVIFMCICCTGLGAIVTGPWYFFRLMQWNSMARAQPQLLDRNAPDESLAKRFQYAKSNLITGMCFGAVIVLIVVVAFLFGPVLVQVVAKACR